MLDQQLKANYTGATIQTEKLARLIIECVDRFAPETFIMSQNNEIECVANKVKNAVMKRDELFHKWVSDRSDFDRETYKKQHNLVTSVIRIREGKPISTNLERIHLQQRGIEQFFHIYRS